MPLSLSPGFRGRGSLAGRPLHLQLLHSWQAQAHRLWLFLREWGGGTGWDRLGPAGGHRTQQPVLWTLQASREGSGPYQPQPRAWSSQPLETLWALSVRNGEGRQAVRRSRTHGFGQGGLSYARAPSPPPWDWAGWGQPLTFLWEGFAASRGWNSALASSHVTLSKWPDHLASWSPGKPGEKMGRGSQPTTPPTDPGLHRSPTQSPSPCAHRDQGTPALVSLPVSASARLLPLLPPSVALRHAAPGEQRPVQQVG